MGGGRVCAGCVGGSTHSFLLFSSSTKASKACTLSSTLLCLARSLRSMGVEGGCRREGALLGAAPSTAATPLGAEMSCCFSHSAHSSGLDSFRAFLASLTRRRGVKARTVTTSTKFRGDLVRWDSEGLVGACYFDCYLAYLMYRIEGCKGVNSKEEKRKSWRGCSKGEKLTSHSRFLLPWVAPWVAVPSPWTSGAGCGTLRTLYTRGG